jgi:hypothetical protein
MEKVIYAKGGKVIAYKNESAKFKKIGIEDKYTIEAITEIGLQGLNFSKETILSKIEEEFQKLIDSYEDYIISEDSEAITKTIEHAIQTMKLEGRAQSDIERYENALTNEGDRQRYISDFADSQKSIVSKWVDYLKQSDYNTSFKYLLLKSVLKFNYDYKLDKLIERNNKTIRNFTPFDAGVIAQLLLDDSDFLLKDYTNIQVKNSLSILNSKEVVKQSGNGHWIKFDGGEDLDSEELEKNANELSQLVQNTYWCTKTNAYSQLQDGDFYVYVTEKDNELFPRIAIRMEGEEVGEVRGNKSNAQDIEEEMLPIAKDFLINNIPNNSGKKWLDSIEFNKRVVNLINDIETNKIANGDIELYLDVLRDERKFNTDYGGGNSNVERLQNVFEERLLAKNWQNDFEYKQVIYGSIGVINQMKAKAKLCFGSIEDYDAEKYPNLEMVTGSVYHRNLSYKLTTGTGKLKFIGGDLLFGDDLIEFKTLGNIEYIGGDCKINWQLEDLGNLKQVVDRFEVKAGFQLKNFGKLNKVGTLRIDRAEYIEDLGEIKDIESLSIEGSKIKTLGNNIKEINGYCGLRGSQIEDLGSLEIVGGSLDIGGTSLKSLGKLKKVEYLDLDGTQIASLGNLEYVEDLYLNDKVKDFGKLKEVKGTLTLDYSPIQSLGNIQKVGELDLRASQINDLGNLEEVTQDLRLNGKIKSLGKLKRVLGDLSFDNRSDSKLQSLNNLEYIGGELDSAGDESLKTLGKLKQVKGSIYLQNSAIEDLGELEKCQFLRLNGCQKIKTLGNLKSVEDLVALQESNIEDLGKLEDCGSIDLSDCKNIKSLGNLRMVRGLIRLNDCSIEDLGKLEQVRHLDVYMTKLPSLNNLKSVETLEISDDIDFANIDTIDTLLLIPEESEKKINLPKLKKVRRLRISQAKVDIVDFDEIENIILEGSSINILKNVKGLTYLGLEDSIINKFENVNLKDTHLKISISDRALKKKAKDIFDKALKEYDEKKDDASKSNDSQDKMKKYELIIVNLAELLLKKDTSRAEKIEIEEALATYQELYKEAQNEQENESKSFKNGGLIAPNGKKSNLTPEQYKLVRTPEFKAWFGDWENDPENASKVVDKNGEPLVVYHGSKSFYITEFDLLQSKRIPSGLKEFGFYFTDNKKLAEAYRDWSDLKGDEKKLIDSEIYKLNKSLDVVRNNKDYYNIEERIKVLQNSKKGKIYGVFLNLKKMHSFNAKKQTNVGAWDNLKVKASYKIASNRDAMEFLKDGLFGVEKVDGIEAKNIVDAFVQSDELKKDLLSNVYLVFDSKNIKLADGTNTTFDGSNPDIRFDDGGKLYNNGGNMKKVDSGGITYGESHDNGGIPVKNASTGEMLEVEGGEGIVNKRSMASDKMVKLNGKDMSICEAVSHLNQMEGGVKFSCDDVEHQQFIEEMALGGELERGKRTEMEHIKVLNDLYAKRITPKQATEKIAKDHLKENPKYYSELRRIEKMANGGKSSCGCSHHTTQYKYGGKTSCGCGGKKYDNGGMTSDTDRLLEKLKALKKPKDDKEDLITQTLSDARNMLDVDYKEQLKNLPPNLYDIIKNVPSCNLYDLGWRCHYTTHKTFAGVCVNEDYDEQKISLEKHNIYISIDFVRNEKNWDKRYKDVVLHEIAHGIVTAYFIERMGYGRFIEIDPLHAETQGHGLIWKAVCSALNPNGNCDQFYKDAILAEEHKNYVYNCLNCGNKKYGNSPTFAKVCNKCYKSIFVEKNNE